LLQAARSLIGVVVGTLVTGLLIWRLHDAWYQWEGRKGAHLLDAIGVLAWTLCGPLVGGFLAALVSGTRGRLHGFLVGVLLFVILLGARDSAGPGTERPLFRPTVILPGAWYQNEHLVLAVAVLLVPPLGGYAGERLLKYRRRRRDA